MSFRELEPIESSRPSCFVEDPRVIQVGAVREWMVSVG